MTDQFDALRSSVVAAVQQELTRFSGQVADEIKRLRDEVATERAARARTEEQLHGLTAAVEARLTEFGAASKRRHDEMDVRLGRVVDEANIGMAAAVEAAARPVLKRVEDRQDHVEQNLVGLDATVRKFDQQAAGMVQHFNAMSEATDARMDEVSAQVGVEVDGRLGALSSRLDEVSAQAARHQAEVSNIVGNRVDQAEERINERILTAEARIGESVGQRVADIDAYVGRVSAGLDDSVTILSDRIAAFDGRFTEVHAAVAAMGTRLDSVDVDAIDELKDRVASAAGEVELVRIEVERFQKSMGDTMDKATSRIVDLETQLQEQYMDVETAVQLERLEEVERAIIALNPDQFVRKADAPSAPPATSPFSSPEPFQPSVDGQF
ncbi:MAG: hypothetical protein WBP59_08605 [Ilumatobacteraceae bacterium]